MRVKKQETRVKKQNGLAHSRFLVCVTPKHNKSANALALCHPPSASFCSVLAVQWSSGIFIHDRYNIPSDILIEFEVNLGIIIEKYAKT